MGYRKSYLDKNGGCHMNLNAEARVQASIVEHLRWVAPQCKVFAVPNGGLRSKSEAARLKWVGVLAGVPDLCLVCPSGRICFIEVKRPGGRLSEEQKKFIDWMISARVDYVVAESIDDVRAALEHWRIPTREHAPAQLEEVS